ncbi:MAG: DHA2 family efflux MFS transporter permease subunit [Trueperaceae bacterium]
MPTETSGRSSRSRLSSRDWRTIFTLLIASFVVILNETIMNVALPRLMVELGVSANTVQWLSTGFLLTMAVVIPMTGFILQRLRTRVVFVTAMGLFCLGTLIAGIAPGFPMLLAGRIVQASGTAIMLPLLMTTILGLVPPERRGAIMGTVSIVISVAPAFGPTVSGLILEALPWRFMFLLVLPIALVVLAFGARRLVDVGEVRRSYIDVPSVVLSALGFGGFVYGVSRAGEGPGAWSHPEVLVALAVGVLSLVFFVGRQLALQRSGVPLLDLRVFRYPMFTLSVGLFMIVMMALFGSMILLPMYLQNVRGFGSLQTGLLLLPGGALMGLAAPFVGRIFDRHGPVALTGVGAGLLTLALWRLSTITGGTSVGMLLALHLVLSLGLALLFTPLMTTGLNPLPSRLYSHGSATMSTLQQVAGAVGTALLITIMTNRAASLGNAVSPQLAQAAGLRSAFAVSAAFALVAMFLTFFLRRTMPDEDDVGLATEPTVSANAEAALTAD